MMKASSKSEVAEAQAMELGMEFSPVIPAVIDGEGEGEALVCSYTAPVQLVLLTP